MSQCSLTTGKSDLTNCVDSNGQNELYQISNKEQFDGNAFGLSPVNIKSEVLTILSNDPSNMGHVLLDYGSRTATEKTCINIRHSAVIDMDQPTDYSLRYGDDDETETETKCKIVTFGNIIEYAQETPLMFSRTSSFSSLGSVEQHSIHDDRSSIISDFSRKTSGVISPSELPDSPTHNVFRMQEDAPNTRTNTLQRNIFEDTRSSFKDENTPAEISRCTSLSSLTIDDDIKIKSSKTLTEPLSNGILYPENSTYENSLFLMMQPQLPNNMPIQASVKDKNVSFCLKSSVADANADIVRTYCTEDTPAALSRVGSASDLSIMSFDKLNCVKEIDHYHLSLDNALNDSNDSFNNDPLLHKSATQKTTNECLNKHTNICADNLNQLQIKPINTSTEHQIESKSSFCAKSDLADNDSSTLNFEARTSQNAHLYNNSDSSEDEQLLQKCIELGRKKIVERIKTSAAQDTSTRQEKQSKLKQKNKSNDIDNLSSSSDDELLQKCIQLGMKKIAERVPTITTDENNRIESKLDANEKVTDSKKPSKTIELDDDSSSDEELLQKCIELGMKKVAERALTQQNDVVATGKHFLETTTTDSANDDSSDEELLQKCIQLGMKQIAEKALINNDSTLNDRLSKEDNLDSENLNGNSSCLSSDEELLQQCIQLGMKKIARKAELL